MRCGGVEGLHPDCGTTEMDDSPTKWNEAFKAEMRAQTNASISIK